jgi:hypothetical protein
MIGAILVFIAVFFVVLFVVDKALEGASQVNQICANGASGVLALLAASTSFMPSLRR